MLSVSPVVVLLVILPEAEYVTFSTCIENSPSKVSFLITRLEPSKVKIVDMLEPTSVLLIVLPL